MASRAPTKARRGGPAAPDDEGASELDRLKDELDPLYAGPPEDFVAARDALAKSLRAQRDRAGATFVKSLRRPSPAAWALNQLHTAAPDVLADWSAAAGAVQAAQRRAMAGGGHGGTLRDATRRMKAAVDRATEAAVRIAEEARRDPGAVRARAAATLHAGASDEAVANALRLGRLDRDHSVAGVWVDAAAGGPSPPPPPGRAQAGGEGGGAPPPATPA